MFYIMDDGYLHYIPKLVNVILAFFILSCHRLLDAALSRGVPYGDGYEYVDTGG